MTLLALLPLVTATLAGVLLVTLLLPRLPGGRATGLLRSSTGMGLGFALSSAWTFLWLPVAGGIGRGLLVLEALVLLGLVLLAWRGRAGGSSAPRGRWPGTDRVLGAAFILAAGSGGAALALRSLSWPHGFWDAWAIWNQRARFLFRAGEEWRRAFSPDLPWSHTDYPLLLPCLVLRGWAYVGSETPWVPALVGCAYTLATVALLVASLTLLQGRAHALVAGTLLLATPLFYLQGAAQCADVPIGFYFLGALALYALESALPEHALRLALLSGALCGCSAWTKNEGALFLVCFVAVRIVLALRRGASQRARLGSFVLGWLPAAILLAGFRLWVDEPSDLLAEQTWEHVVASLLDPGRYASVLLECARVLRAELLPVLVAALLSALLLGAFRRHRVRSVAAGPGAVLGLLALGYFFIYVTTPKPLAWHLATSLSRIAVQLWPSALLCMFLLVGTKRDRTTS